MARIFSPVLALVVLLCGGLYFVPAINQRVAWRLANFYTRVHYLIRPPDRQVFVPGAQPSSAAPATTPIATTILASATPAPLSTAAARPTPVPSPTSLPAQVALTGIRYEWQTFNNCGPANLAMALSFWGWQGDQRDTKAGLRPNDDDANVLPEELLAFTARQPGLNAALRVGGDLPRLKSLLAAGFPVILEMGHDPADDWWMGHYVLVSGYDDARDVLITQDSLIMPDLPLPYAEIETSAWRDFNRLYLALYPREREAEILRLLGDDADPHQNLLRALDLIHAEIPTLTGRDLFFALYNQADLLLALGDPSAAGAVYDRAFQVYAAIPEDDRPWRVYWYRPGPYQAYYQTGRYPDVIRLADAVLAMLSKRGLEESHYWRGLAYAALGDRDKALFDFEIALRLRPTYAEAQQALDSLDGN